MEENIKNLSSFLSFKLGKETFAADVSQVLNILELVRITEVPNSPEFMKGIINLRGEVLPVIDTRLKFGLEEAEHTKNTCILVLEVEYKGEETKVGALVDSVLEVLEIEETEIKAPPQIGEKSKNSFIRGMVKVEDQFIIILNANKVFSDDEILDLDKSSKNIKETENVSAE